MSSTEAAAPGGPGAQIKLPDVKMHVHGPGSPAIGVCVASERVTAKKSAGFVRHVAFDVSGTGLAGAWRAGQSFGVIPPGVDAQGRPHKLRLYSIASPTRGEDGRGTVLATTVKRTIDEHNEHHKLFLGVASNYLCDLQVGDKVQLTGPSGKRFVLPENPVGHDYIFLATGTGIAPFRGMVMDLLEAKASSRIVLVMGTPYATDLLYDRALRDLEQRHANFRYLTAISRERQEDGHGPIYVQDRLRTHQNELGSILRSPRTLIYICGLAGMELGIFRRLSELLPADELAGYLRIDPKIAGTPGRWERSMVNRELAPTRRVFLEVY